MIIVVDVADSTVSLDEPDVVDAFKVVVGDEVDAAAVGALLEDLGAGRLADEPDHVWVRIDTMRLLAEDQVDDGWSVRFDAMVAYATTKGWVDDHGSALKAHIEP